MSKAHNAHDFEEQEGNSTVTSEPEVIAIASNESNQVDETFGNEDDPEHVSRHSEIHNGSHSILESTWDEIQDEEDLPVDEIVDKGWSDNSIITRQMRYTLDGIQIPEPEATNFGSVRINDSSNVHLGNRTFYKGPVYVKQYIYANSTSINDNNAIPVTGSHSQETSSQLHETDNSRTDESIQDEKDGNSTHYEDPPNEQGSCLFSFTIKNKIRGDLY
ncbi:hypothetical protein QAD02_023215 [Eretmocerus hayati]|uniref:Uncharacterized protein n=1 Tax=Eretmocerus hayati TaxID=131215 RepID=A0ACC2PWU9_9HYME|nr:hypothetical protein QAD02_023215 [Eretmocerus hayati]